MYSKIAIFTEIWDLRFWPEIKPLKTFGDFLARNKTPKQTFGCLDLKGGGLKATPRYTTSEVEGPRKNIQY